MLFCTKFIGIWKCRESWRSRFSSFTQSTIITRHVNFVVKAALSICSVDGKDWSIGKKMVWVEDYHLVCCIREGWFHQLQKHKWNQLHEGDIELTLNCLLWPSTIGLQFSSFINCIIASSVVFEHVMAKRPKWVRVRARLQSTVKLVGLNPAWLEIIGTTYRVPCYLEKLNRTYWGQGLTRRGNVPKDDSDIWSDSHRVTSCTHALLQPHRNSHFQERRI